MHSSGPNPNIIQAANQAQEMARLARHLAASARVPEATVWLENAIKRAPTKTELRKEFINQLVDDGILYKRRGIGMFVSPGARAKLRHRRREHFSDQFLRPLLLEAHKLGLSPAELKDMIDAWEKDT